MKSAWLKDIPNPAATQAIPSHNFSHLMWITESLRSPCERFVIVGILERMTANDLADF